MSALSNLFLRVLLDSLRRVVPCSLTAAAYGDENVVFASDAERPTIVVWLVLLVMALMVVAFVSRLVEEYRLADRFSNVQKKRLYHAKQHAPS